MGKTILFSPVGGTDPMSEKNLHDGALIHISRHYKPDVIYMYMSKEVLDFQAKDNRYKQCIEWLGEKLSCTFDVKEIARPDLTKVQLFDPIYKDFEQILEDITAEMNQDDKLLLNISSGTPAMKSALLVLATMIDIPCECIQVDTPVNGMNEHEHTKAYDVNDLALRWELNPDNTGEYAAEHVNYNRTHSEKLISLKRLKYEETIKKYVASYDYHAALVLAESMDKTETASYIEKLKLADARQRLDGMSVDKLLVNQDKTIYRPIGDRKERIAYEYMLALQAKVYRSEFPDFLRGITPLFVELFRNVLENNSSFKLSEYTAFDEKKKMLLWDADKLKTSQGEKYNIILNNAYRGKFDGGWVKSDHLCHLIKELTKKQPAISECIERLRKVEEKVRNEAAHNMIYVSDERIKEKTGYTSEKILGLIRKAFQYSSYSKLQVDWKSYDKMNEDILGAI